MEDLAICDANILIDLLDSPDGIDAIKAITKFFKSVFVPDVIINEVKKLSNNKELINKTGLTVITTPLDAIKTNIRGLSFQDCACLYFVKINKFVCLTNDMKLRKCCIEANAEVIWGLELLLMLAESNLISIKMARSIGNNIFESNITITGETFGRFNSKLNDIASKNERP